MTLFAGVMALSAADEDVDVAVLNRVTFLGEQQAPVDPVLNPKYYQFITRGYVNFGRVLPGEQDPEETALLQHLAAVLRPMGYLPADEEHKPRIAFTVPWGSAIDEWQHALEYINLPRIPIKWEPLPANSMRKNTRLRDNWPDLHGSAVRKIMQIGYKDAYLFALAACDWDNASTGREVYLWQVRALTPFQRIPAEAAFHRMIDAIVPYLGRHADQPHVVVARAERATASLTFGFDNNAQRPAPIDLSTTVAHDFGPIRF